MLKNNKGFTLAEVLITLVIIGIVATLTIPTLINNYQKHQYVIQLKKNYNILSNGFRMILAKEGVTRVTDTTLWSKFGNTSSITYETANNNANKQAFLAELSKTFSIASTSSPEVTYSTWLRNAYATMTSSLSGGIVLKDGTIIYYTFYKTPKTEYGGDNFTNYVGMLSVDVNGTKKPNVMGRDLFRFWLFSDGVIEPFGANQYQHGTKEPSPFYWQTYGACGMGDTIPGYDCAGRIMDKGWKMDY